jgi:hypothetical protein
MGVKILLDCTCKHSRGEEGRTQRDRNDFRIQLSEVLNSLSNSFILFELSINLSVMPYVHACLLEHFFFFFLWTLVIEVQGKEKG